MEYWRSAVDKVTTWTFLKFKFLDNRNLNQAALENTFGATRLHCSSNSYPSDALKTVVINGLACMSLAERMVVPPFWTSYTHFSSHPVLHEPVHRQGITGRPLTVFLTLFIVEEKHNVE
jgi:hypothetical protein